MQVHTPLQVHTHTHTHSHTHAHTSLLAYWLSLSLSPHTHTHTHTQSRSRTVSLTHAGIRNRRRRTLAINILLTWQRYGARQSRLAQIQTLIGVRWKMCEIFTILRKWQEEIREVAGMFVGDRGGGGGCGARVPPGSPKTVLCVFGFFIGGVRGRGGGGGWGVGGGGGGGGGVHTCPHVSTHTCVCVYVFVCVAVCLSVFVFVSVSVFAAYALAGVSRSCDLSRYTLVAVSCNVLQCVAVCVAVCCSLEISFTRLEAEKERFLVTCVT